MRQNTPDEVAYSFEEEVFFSLRRQRNIWSVIAILSLILAIACIGFVAMLLPLKEVRPYLVMVDKTTGEAERLAQVEPLSLSEQEAVIQAELVRYVTDRETYDVADNATRIPDVLNRSTGQAAESLRALWNSANEDYPPELYEDRNRLKVTIVSMSLLGDSHAQVRFRKALQESGLDDIERDFVATVRFAFEPKVERNLQAVWANPLGFKVSNYRIDAETLTNRGAR
ncbi:type IV secretion system protein [Roseibium sp. HPY-6]|uniref:virB8 family protein n=1 Tax=Roseibium sp. HPY-6 TaxID=3229852 RepID=UPI00339023FB